ncbi:hypothetical protein RB195_017573 [Necator americanus]|uniref:Uncharacterized protein n=1 Tax=Necator americanus TaxID=51031 RepID=A0ABR1C5U2_NECAM
MPISQEQHLLWQRSDNNSPQLQNRIGGRDHYIKTVHRPFARFPRGDTMLKEKHRSGCLRTVENRAILGAVKQDPEVSNRRLAMRLDLSQPAVLSRPSSHPEKYWIPHTLSDDMRNTQISICQSLILRPHRAARISTRSHTNTSKVEHAPQEGPPPSWDSRELLYDLFPQRYAVTSVIYGTQLRKLTERVREK